MADDTIRVSWLGQSGTLQVVHHARVLNISEEGMAFELPEAAQLVTRVKLHSDKHKLLGEGIVRHCRHVGAKYVVGVEFSDGLRWRAPGDSVPEPISLTDPGRVTL